MAKSSRKVLLKPAETPEPEKVEEKVEDQTTPVDQTDEEPAESDQDDSEDEEGGDDQGDGDADAQKPPQPPSKGVTKTVTIGGTKEPVRGKDGAMRLPWTQQHYAGMPLDGIVLAPGEPLYVRGVRRGVVIELTESVYQAAQHSTTIGYIYSLVYAAGQRVPADNCVLVTDRV